MRRFHSLVKFPDFLQAELDRNLPNFFDGLEIGDATLADGRRVVLFTWKQVGIISAEISEECWIPIAFGLLPDKKRDTYDTFLGLLLFLRIYDVCAGGEQRGISGSNHLNHHLRVLH